MTRGRTVCHCSTPDRGNRSSVRALLAAVTLVVPQCQAMPAREPVPGVVRVLQEIREATHRNGQALELNDIDRERLVAALPKALELSRTAESLWARVRLDNDAAGAGITLYEGVQGGLRRAALTAATKEEKERWLRSEFALVQRFLQDPQTRRIWEDRRDPQSDASDYSILTAIQMRHFGEVRGLLGRAGLLAPDDWGFYHGLEWVSGAAAVQVRNRTACVDASVLQRVGLPIHAGGTGIVAAQDGRRAIIGFGNSSRLKPGQAFRDRDGKVFIPVAEFHRQGLWEVRVRPDAQMVQIWMERPSSDPPGELAPAASTGRQ